MMRQDLPMKATPSVLADTGARGAPLRQAVIIAACSTVEPLKRLQPRHRPPVRVLGTMDSNRHAQRAALSRHSLSAGPDLRDVARRCPRPAGAALLVPQGDAPSRVLRPARDRCAALAARVRGCLSAAEGVLPRASQDRARGPVRASPPSWPLSTPTLRAVHGYVRLVGVVRRSEERGRDARAMGHMCDPRRISSLYGLRYCMLL